jgi:nucleoside-diphosphate-sugar epimerase
MIMRILVTGGAGFLGRYVLRRLREVGYDIVSADIASEQERERLDVTDLDAVCAVFSRTKPDVVIHLAALTGSSGQGGGRESIQYPYDYFRTNFLGTLSVFEACRRLEIGQVIHMSSFSPYGVVEGPINETTRFQPTNPYGSSKECGEAVAKCYASNYGIKTLIFRAPLLAGENQKEENALREFARSVKKGQPIVIYGDGSHLREWLHPIDVAEAFLKGIAYFDSMTTPYEVFVLGNKPISMKDLARLVTAKVGGGIRHQEGGRVFDQYTDSMKVETILKWKPKLQVQDIIDRVVAEIFGTTADSRMEQSGRSAQSAE